MPKTKAGHSHLGPVTDPKASSLHFQAELDNNLGTDGRAQGLNTESKEAAANFLSWQEYKLKKTVLDHSQNQPASSWAVKLAKRRTDSTE